jgi:hypothetical protein
MRKALHAIRHLPNTFATYWHQSRIHKVTVAAVTVIVVALLAMFGIAEWYIWSERSRPLVLGTSFIADYAEYLGLDPHQTLTAILDDLQVKHLRLVSYWSDIEQTKGTYNFSELDWEFQQANAHGAKVTLAIGLRQPRWPECHMPDWATNEPKDVWQPQLQQFMSAVINHYKHNPALASYQLENEYFLTAFASCADQSRGRLVEEAALVKRLDPSHTLIISRSQNAIGWPVNAPLGDETGISIYRRVWQPSINRYMEYPFPAWFYAFLAGAEKLWTGHDTIIHELQMEPWPPTGQNILTSSLAEQSNTIDATRFNQTINFAERTGMKTIDLWGSEYWYYRKVTLHDPSVWNAAKQAYQQANR